MQIPNSQTAAVIRALREAIDNQQLILAVDARLLQLSTTDLHFFSNADSATDFAAFNQGQGRPIELMPADTALHAIKAQFERSLEQGEVQPVVVLDPAFIRSVNEARQEYLLKQELEEQMDLFNWKQVFYDPLEANTELERYADRVAFRRLEWLVEQLTAYAQSGKASYDFVSELVHRHWQGNPMEVQIINVLNGDFVQLVQEQFYQLKNEHDMNQDNLDYLKKQLFFTGFGEGLNAHLEKKIKEGVPEFTLPASHAFGQDKMEAVLHFSRSKQDGSDMYFFNKYEATLEGQNGRIDQTFYINNKGKSLSFEDACQLMNGRSVFMEVTPKEGGPYKAWIKIDFANKDENGNFKLNYFNGNYGFNLHEAVGRIPLKELGNPDRMEAIYAGLQRGRLVDATLLKGGREISVQLAADPKFKTLKMYDADGVKLFVPGPKPETQYGQAPADERKQLNGQQPEVGQPLGGGKEKSQGQDNVIDTPGDTIKKKDLLQSKPEGSELMPKNRANRGKGVSIS